ncbi:MAG: hypothetical protein WC476_10995 [Phycisphaerae bacterium]
MSSKKSFLILSIILLVGSICGVIDAKEIYAGGSNPNVVYHYLGGTAEAKPDNYEITPLSNPTDVTVSSEYITTGTIEGLVQTTPGDPNWALVTSDAILRENICYSGWYDRVFNPCYSSSRYWKLESGTNVGKAFTMSGMGIGTFDGLYVREGFGFQLYYNTEEPSDPCGLEPASPYMWGPQYVSIDYWWGLGPDGFEPNAFFEPHTFFVSGEQGALSNYSIIINHNILEISKTDDVNDGDCVGPGDAITYRIDYSYPGKANYFGYKGLTDFHEWWLCDCNSNNSDCNGMDADKDGVVNFTDFATLAGNWLKGQLNDINIIDYLPEDADFISASAGRVYNSNSHTVTWNIGTLEPGESGLVTLTVKVNPCAEQAEGKIANYSEIKSDDEILDATYEYTAVCWANTPEPSHGETEVPEDVNLSWTPGIYADKHDVYLGTDYTAVKDVNDPNTPPGRGRQDSNSYDPCETFDSDTTYYWRIDEVNGPNVWKGAVWRFRTTNHNYLITEDFDLYANTDELDDLWIVDGTAVVYLETAKVRSGNLMKFEHQNWVPPYRAEAGADTLALPSGIGTNWTADGAEALVLYFFDKLANDADEQMYVKLTDGSSHSAIVSYDDGDAYDVREPYWHEWNIALADFAGVDMNDVRHLILGVGDGVAPSAPTYQPGIVYFDDIRLYPPRCLEGPAGDLTGDCVVDYRDLEVMTDEWLDTNYCCEANIYKDNNVNFRDFAILAENWLKEGQLWPE